MRILMVSNLFPPEFIGGYELIAFELASRLAGSGHQVAVVTSPLVNHVAEIRELPFAVYRSLNWLGLDSGDPGRAAFREAFILLANIASLRGAIEQFRPDRILLCNIAGLGVLGIVTFLHEAGFRPAIYLGDNVFALAGMDPGTRDAFLRLFRSGPALSALRILAVSRGVYKEAEESLASPLGEALFVPGWVPDDLPELPPRRQAGPIRFVFSSRIAPHKGIWVLLDAAKLLLARGETDFVIDAYGTGLVPEFIQRVHAFGLGEHIRYGGLLEREEMIRRFADYDALLFPTWQREPLGLVPFEAAAQGCIPIITAQAGACEWMLGCDCIKIERSPEGLAGGMQRLLYMPPGERDRIRRTASANTRRFFSSGVWFPRIERLIRELPDPSPGVSAKRIQDAMFTITRMWRG